MCTLIMLRRPDHPWPVLVAANRDEMLARPWQPPARHWPDRAEAVAGLDQQAGGTWLGINDHGVVAGVLNRVGVLGPAEDKRSRGELVLEALDHADARDAAEALGRIDGRAYRPFNLVIADNRDAYWVRHADPDRRAVQVLPLADGLSMVTAYDVDDPGSPRTARYRPLFADAAVPDPDTGDWRAWQRLLAEPTSDIAGDPSGAMNIRTDWGFGTVSSSLIALPAPQTTPVRPIWLFAAGAPDSAEYRPIDGLQA